MLTRHMCFLYDSLIQEPISGSVHVCVYFYVYVFERGKRERVKINSLWHSKAAIICGLQLLSALHGSLRSTIQGDNAPGSEVMKAGEAYGSTGTSWKRP